VADGIPDKVFRGSVSAINSIVDPSTRNIQIQATVRNPDQQLRSGMFAAVQVVLPSREKVTMIPATAVHFAPYGNSVFVLGTMRDEAGKEYLGVHQQTVVLGKTRGDQIEVTDGLEDGAEIATSGIFRLRDKGPVSVNNAVQPGNNPAPKPSDS
jgi:membrane fusion protein (multidrug efflux system)